jgi:Cd2+/Zn2+-exporting ATPase
MEKCCSTTPEKRYKGHQHNHSEGDGHDHDGHDHSHDTGDQTSFRCFSRRLYPLLSYY